MYLHSGMSEMSEDEERHLDGLKCRITQLLDAKYRKGQKIHGGQLWEKRVFPELRDEMTDFVSYVLTLEGHIHEAKVMCNAAKNGDIPNSEAIDRVLELL